VRLGPHPGGLYVDATVGGGGHAQENPACLRSHGALIGLDWDDEASRRAASGWRSLVIGSAWCGPVLRSWRPVLMNLEVTAVDGCSLTWGSAPGSLTSRRAVSVSSAKVCWTCAWTAALRQPLGTFFVPPAWRNWCGFFQDYGEERRARAIAREIGHVRERGELPATTVEAGAAG